MTAFEPRALVLDTSVWINLLATGHASAIVKGLACPIAVPEQVLGELKLDPVTRRPFVGDIHPALQIPMVELVSLGGDELDIFVELVSADAPDRLGDGEAASIAIAWKRQLQLGIDEKKANRLLRERFSSIPAFRSTELLAHPSIALELGHATASDCYERAVRYGRMHIVRSPAD
ncbi:hypothetical protein [Phenylobacterium sp.]|uniref:hypothetical protein n=1 Tax=Phenylobacterium sp. TaxID=1871053 RepID=UPI002731FC7D|nr:hypothetical protein [Phenylobacterium sp.]MDP1616501.1 hypothetical protein [Phenylobacterium sp.]MDP1987768.1 hypothetical protein [Phenylobacterium sp.]